MATAASAAQDGVDNDGKDRTLNIEIVLHKSARKGKSGGKWRVNPNATLSIVKDASAGPEPRWRRRPTPLEVVVDDNNQEKGGGVQVVSPASTLPAMGVNYSSGSGGRDHVVRARTPSPVQASIQRVTSSSEAKYAWSGTGSREKLELMRRRVFGKSGHRSSASPASTIELPAAEQHEGEASLSQGAIPNAVSLVTSRAAGATDELTRQNSRLRAEAKLLEEDLAIAVKERGRSRGQRKGAEREAEDITLIAEREFTRNRLEAAEARWVLKSRLHESGRCGRCADLQAEVELLRIGSQK
ncbi:hypothetical protein FOZ62_005192, partial [Perkinsus olseni]